MSIRAHVGYVLTLIGLGLSMVALAVACGTPGPLPPLPGPIGPDLPPAVRADGGGQ